MPPESTRSQDELGETSDATRAPALPNAVSDADSHYTGIFEAMPLAIALIQIINDEQGELVDLALYAANRAFRTILDIPDLVGQRASEVDPRYREKYPDIFDLCNRIATGESVDLRGIHLPRLDRWFDFKLTTFPGDLVLLYVEDTTERRKADADLRRLQYSLDHVEDSPIWNDSSGRIVEVSESTCRQLGYSRDELLNMTVFDIAPAMDREKWAQRWSELPPSEFLRTEVTLRTKSGHTFPAEITVHSMMFDGKQYHCTVNRDISDRKALEKSLALTQFSVDNAPDMIHWVDPEGHITYANHAMCEFLGYTLEELQTMDVWDVSPELVPEVFKQRWAAAAKGPMYMAEEVWVTKDGREATVDISAVHVEQDGKKLGLAFVRDISERKAAEQTLKESENRYRQLWQTQTETVKTLRERDEQLLQAQKMEAIGRLAGGIAHDFNNVLTTIMGFSDLLLSSPELPEGTVAADIAEIRDAAERAAGLTQRILAFARRQAMEPTVMSLNKVVSDTERLLERTLGADIELSTSLSPDLALVEVDEHQFVQVLLNLAVNARDAMPEGGTLTLETANIDLDEQFCGAHPECAPGPYVMLAVRDTGAGMDEEIMSHVFEPFYTTKPPGLGTGLGLATVYGVVTQSGGCVYMDSKPGQGTSVIIYLPQVEAATSSTELESQGPESQVPDKDQPIHTVVVVDSDAPFRNLATRILQRHGLKVLSFRDGEQATAAFADPGQQIDALLADTSLSGHLQGGQLASLATMDRPNLPVLFMTAQSGGPQDGRDQDGLNAAYLEKPFTAEELTDWVQTWLAEPGSTDPKIEQT